MLQFERAVSIDEDFTEAWFRIGNTHVEVLRWGLTEPGEHLAKALEAFDRVLELEPDHVRTLATQGELLWRMEGDVTSAEERIRRAVRIAPDDFWARVVYGMFLAVVGRRSEAYEQVQNSSNSNPTTWKAS